MRCQGKVGIPGRRRGGAVLAVLLAALAGGCAAPAAGPGPYPDDLALDVTVIHRFARHPRFHRYRCDRYVLLADGSLHRESRAGRSAAWFPAYRRTLVSEQIAALWQLIEEHGLGEAGSEAPVNPAHLDPGPQGATCLGVVTGGGRRWAHAGRLDGEEADASLALLVSRLDALGWAAP